MINYSELFNVAYSTSISEDVKEAIFSKVNMLISEAKETSESRSYINFLDSMAFSGMSEELTDEIIERVLGNLDESFVEEIYEEYIRVKSVQYINEYNGPIGLASLNRQAQEREAKEQKATERKESFKDAFDTAKNNLLNKVNNVKQVTSDKAKEVGQVVSNKANEIKSNVKQTAETAKNVAGYTGHLAKGASKTVMDKVKGAVNKVKNWWGDYKQKANDWAKNKNKSEVQPTTSTKPQPTPSSKVKKAVIDMAADNKPVKIDSQKEESKVESPLRKEVRKPKTTKVGETPSVIKKEEPKVEETSNNKEEKQKEGSKRTGRIKINLNKPKTEKAKKISVSASTDEKVKSSKAKVPSNEVKTPESTKASDDNKTSNDSTKKVAKELTKGLYSWNPDEAKQKAKEFTEKRSKDNAEIDTKRKKQAVATRLKHLAQQGHDVVNMSGEKLRALGVDTSVLGPKYQ